MKFVSKTYTEMGRGGREGWFKGIEIAGRRTGFDRSRLRVSGELYMDRWILYVGGYTLRLHKFYRGDDNRASHTHPWWFITFPLTSYTEKVFSRGTCVSQMRIVRAWRFHYRPADFEHYVIGRSWWWEKNRKQPFWTIVFTGPMRDSWGFYPAPNKFIPWRLWK